MKNRVTFILFLVLAAANVQAQVFPRLEPDPQAVQYAQAGGAYPWDALAEISLWASGDISLGTGMPRGKASYMDQLRSAAAELGSAPDFPVAEKEQAEYILAFIHRKFLRSYSPNQTRIDTLLANGRYNCVSSAVLYLILGRSCGLDVSGVMTKDHAFAVVRIGDERIDVETTNASGFDPGNRREFHDQFGKVTGFSYVPARNYRDRMPIGAIELVSLILSNRISELESRKRFFEAVPLAVDRAALLGASGAANSSASGANGDASTAPLFESPRRDVMNRIFNYGAYLLNTGKEDECLRWVAHASPRYPDDKGWQEFVYAAVNNRIQKLAKAGQFTPAREFLEQHKPALVPGDYTALDSMLTDTELVGRASKIRSRAEGDGVLDAIETAQARGLIDNSRAGEMVTVAVQKTAALISGAHAGAHGRDWSGAVTYIQQAAARFGMNRNLERLLRDYQTNHAIDFHNRFAAAWNRKSYDEARRIVTDGLALFPDNKQLLEDKNAFTN